MSRPHCSPVHPLVAGVVCREAQVSQRWSNLFTSGRSPGQTGSLLRAASRPGFPEVPGWMPGIGFQKTP